MRMGNSELIGCDLAWKRDGADWLLLHKRRRMGRVAPDHNHRGMYRLLLPRGRLSDMRTGPSFRDRRRSTFGAISDQRMPASSLDR